MGTPDSYFDKDSNIQVQLKIDPNACACYTIGHTTPLPDGVYVDYSGCVVIIDSKVAAVFDKLTNKYGGNIDLKSIINPHNPVYQAVQEVKRELGIDD